MARNWIVFLSLVAGLLFGASSLLAQEAAAPASAKEVDARTLVPGDVILYIEIRDLAKTWQAIKAGPLYEQLLETEGGKDLQVLAAAIQTHFQVNVGATLEQLVTGLLGQRVVLAAWPSEEGTVGALLTEVADATFAQEMLAALRQQEIDEGKAVRFDKETYRGHTIYAKVPPAPRAEGQEAPLSPKTGKLEYSVLCGNVAIFGDSVATLELLIDRFEETPTTSILDDERFTTARASLPADYWAMAFVDFEKALAEAPLDEERIVAGKPPVARFLAQHFLSVVRSLRQGVVAVYLNPSGPQVRLLVTRDPALLTEGARALFSQENATPQALSYLSSDGVLLVSLPRVTAQMKLISQALELALPAAAPPTPDTTEVQPIRPLDLILGRNFTREVLPGIGPEISLLVEANPADLTIDEGAQGVEHIAAQLTAALFVELNNDLRPEVERLVNTALGLLMTVAQEACTLSQLRVGEVTGYVIQPKKAEPPSLDLLLQPTIAFVDGFLVVCTHPRALERALATKAAQHAGYEARFLTSEEPGTLSGHIVVLADLQRALEALQVAHPAVVAEQAQNVASLLEFLRPLAGQLTLTVQHTPAETNANLSLRTATPLLK